MSDFGKIILVIIATSFVVTTVWNIYSLNYLKKRTFLSNDQLNDAKYFELKSKYEFLLAVFSVITAVAIFIGFNTKENIEQSLKKSIVTGMDSINRKIDSANIKIKEFNQSADIYATAIEMKFRNSNLLITRYSQSLSSLEKKQINIDTKGSKSSDQIDSINKKIFELNSKNILKQNFYLVDSLTYNPDTLQFKAKTQDDLWKTFYFKNLRTSIGDKLPNFSSPPFAIPISEQGATMQIRNITTESFQIASFETWQLKPADIYFKIFISEIR